MSKKNEYLDPSHFDHHQSLAAKIAKTFAEDTVGDYYERFCDPKGIKHHREFVLKINGVEYINDSASENVNATWYSIQTITKPIVWIAGGSRSYEYGHYDMIQSLVEKKVHTLICLDEVGISLQRMFNHTSLIVNAHSIEDAVRFSFLLAHQGDCVLFSPSCKLRQSFESAGDEFKKRILSL